MVSNTLGIQGGEGFGRRVLIEVKAMQAGYFSVSFQLIVTDRPIPYSLYVNSSSLVGVERYVRIFKKDEILTLEDRERFQGKYHRLYVSESERSAFLKAACEQKGASTTEKAAVIKDSAIRHLDNLFQNQGQLTTEMLGEAINGCRDAVEGMIDVLHDCNVDQLRDHIAQLSFHDFYTYDHSINVAMYSILVYRALNPKAKRKEIMQAGMGGMLHDLGKIEVPTDILNKPGKLSDEEFAFIRKHPGFGVDLFSQTWDRIPKDMDPDALTRVIFEHHENFDGTGYPDKIQGEKIHLLARVVSIADFFDAITTKRSYHEPLSVEDAIAVMNKSVGKKLDPKIFAVFVDQAKAARARVSAATSKLELPSDFDPCQPHDALPFKKDDDGDSGSQAA